MKGDGYNAVIRISKIFDCVHIAFGYSYCVRLNKGVQNNNVYITRIQNRAQRWCDGLASCWRAAREKLARAASCAAAAAATASEKKCDALAAAATAADGPIISAPPSVAARDEKGPPPLLPHPPPWVVERGCSWVGGAEHPKAVVEVVGGPPANARAAAPTPPPMPIPIPTRSCSCWRAAAAAAAAVTGWEEEGDEALAPLHVLLLCIDEGDSDRWEKVLMMYLLVTGRLEICVAPKIWKKILIRPK